MSNPPLVQSKVGRPARNDARKSVPTFFTAKVRDDVRKMAKDSGMYMSDWLDGQILLWLSKNGSRPTYVAKTHSRKDASGTEWPAVQVVLLQDTYDRLFAYAHRFDVSIAGLIFTIARNITNNDPILDLDHFD